MRRGNREQVQRGTMSQSKWRRLSPFSVAHMNEAKKRTGFMFYANHPHSNPKPTPRGEGWPT